MDKVNTSSSGGIGLSGLLTVLFVALKLIGKIDWSWWWVLSPVWISIGLMIIVLVLALLIAVAADR